MFLLYNQKSLIRLFPADFCKTKENTPIKVFQAEYSFFILTSLLYI